MNLVNNESQAVVFHCSNAVEDVQRAIAAASAVATEDPGIRATVIVNGPALEGLRQTAQELELPEGIEVNACRIGLSKRDIPPDELQPGIELTDSAVVALTRAQLRGAAYIRI